MANVFQLFKGYLHTCVLPDLRQYGVYVEEAGVGESVPPIMIDEAHQSVMREDSPASTQEAMEGADPVGVSFALSCIS